MLLFHSSNTKQISKKMLGNMKPSEIWELVKDQQIKKSDVPRWVDLMIEEYCTVLVRRFEFYEARYENRFGNVESLIEKMVHYKNVWVNWDGLEPFPWREERPIKYFFDSNLQIPARSYET